MALLPRQPASLLLQLHSSRANNTIIFLSLRVCCRQRHVVQIMSCCWERGILAPSSGCGGCLWLLHYFCANSCRKLLQMHIRCHFVCRHLMKVGAFRISLGYCYLRRYDRETTTFQKTARRTRKCESKNEFARQI